MNVIYNCPTCGNTHVADIDASTRQFVCPQCESPLISPENSVVEKRVNRCLVCGSDELFLRKDFPQRLGVGIVVLGFVLSSIAWYYHAVLLTFGILFATAFLDLVLFLVMGTVLECYRCHAQYRGSQSTSEYAPFDLERHERHRQEAIRTKRG